MRHGILLGRVRMQRNEVDAVLTSSSLGLGTPELWQRLSLELDGKTVLEKPHVSKSVLLKAIRMQTEAMRYMVDEFDRLREKMSEMERDARNVQKHVERVNTKVITLQGQVEDVNTKVYELETQQNQQVEQLKKIDEVAGHVRLNRDEIRQCQQRVDQMATAHDELAAMTETQFASIRQEQEVTKQFAMQLEDRMNTEEKELFLDSDHILHQKLSLSMWMEMIEKENRKKDEALRECSDKMVKQGKNVHEMMLETRRTLDDNTCAVEDVQRMLLDKADKARMEECIETKYEEICNQLDKALSAVIGEEDEFKRVSQELQQLVTHLSESKADKKDLLEVKEQVLYDSRVRQQVENLRSFIDLKMNRDDVFSALKNKADKDEMVALLKSLSEGMNASIVHAQRTMIEPENAFLTGKNAIAHGSQKRTGMLPSIEREKCLSCNSTLRESASTGTIANKSPFPMPPVYGGGFQLPSTEKGAVLMKKNGHHNGGGYSSNNAAEANGNRLGLAADGGTEG